MPFETMVMLSFISTATMIITALRIFSWKTLIGFHWLADVIFTVTLVYLFSGTVSGMIIAIMSGFLFSVTLTLGRILTPKEINNEVH